MRADRPALSRPYRFYQESNGYLSGPMTLDEAIEGASAGSVGGGASAWLVCESSDGTAGRLVEYTWGGQGTLGEPAWMDASRTATLLRLRLRDLAEKMSPGNR